MCLFEGLPSFWYSAAINSLRKWALAWWKEKCQVAWGSLVQQVAEIEIVFNFLLSAKMIHRQSVPKNGLESIIFCKKWLATCCLYTKSVALKQCRSYCMQRQDDPVARYLHCQRIFVGSDPSLTILDKCLSLKFCEPFAKVLSWFAWLETVRRISSPNPNSQGQNATWAVH